MKRLLALTALCLPLYLFAQGFGSFSHDQPFLAKDTAAYSDPCSFAPTNIVGCFFWVSSLVTNSVLGKYGTNASLGSRVGQWKDLSGYGNDLSNSIISYGPTFYTGVGSGGRLTMAMSYSSSRDFMTNNFMAAKTNPFTMFFAMSCNAVGDRVFFQDSYATNYAFQQYVGGTLRTYLNGTMLETAPSFPNGSWNVFTMVANGTNIFVRTNGVFAIAGTGVKPTYNINYGIRIGGSNAGQFFDGYMSEIIMFDQVLTAAEMRQVEEYLACKSSITIY